MKEYLLTDVYAILKQGCNQTYGITLSERNYGMINKKLRISVAECLKNEHWSLKDGSSTRSEFTKILLKSEYYEEIFENLEVTNTFKLKEALDANKELMQIVSDLYVHLKNERDCLLTLSR